MSDLQNIDLQKATARNVDGNGFTIVDYSKHIELIPRVNKLTSQLGLFSKVFQNSDIAEVERVQEIVELFQARARGGERNFVGSENAELRHFKVPFFPLDRNITAQDIQNFRQYGEANAPKTLGVEVAKVMRRIRNSHDQLVEKVSMEAIQGRSYIGGGVGTVYNYYTSWGLTQQTANVDFTDTAVDPRSIIESGARKHIQDEAQDQAGSYKIVAIVGSTWFDGLKNHTLVKDSYNFYSSDKEPLRRRLGEDSINRVWTTDNVTYIEDISGYVAATEAYIFPMGIPDMFELHYAPKDDVAEANQTAKELYLEYKEAPFFRQYKVESETSILGVNKRPELVVKSTGTF